MTTSDRLESMPADLAAISVRRRDLPAWLGFRSGTVLIDGKRAGRLSGGRWATVRVAPGTYRVSIRIEGAECRPHALTLAPGERAALNFAPGRFRAWLRATFLALGYLGGVTFGVTAALAARWAWKTFVYEVATRIWVPDELFLLVYRLAPVSTSASWVVPSTLAAIAAWGVIWAKLGPLAAADLLPERGRIEPDARSRAAGPEFNPVDGGELGDNACVRAAVLARASTRRATRRLEPDPTAGA